LRNSRVQAAAGWCHTSHVSSSHSSKSVSAVLPRAALQVHTELGGVYTLRLAVGSVWVRKADIDASWASISAAADQVLAAAAAAGGNGSKGAH
jgi:1,2-phenylacetyl-CoA epoxidase PaaB subunit